MIASLFNKSNPINFIIVLVITVLAFVNARTNLITQAITPLFVLKQTGLFFICIITISVFHFIVSKNNLTKSNNFEILFFSLFLLTLVHTTSNTAILIANFSILLGLRRIISLRSQKDIKSKLFDAALWIALASLFYFWALTFFVVIIFSLFFYSDNSLRHWLIPFIGLATVFSISIGFSVLYYNDYFAVFNASRSLNFDYTGYNSIKYIVAITILLSFGLWSSIFYLQNIKQQKKELRASFKIVVISAIVGFIIALMAPEKNGSEFLFLFAPLSIIITNYIQTIQEKWFKEVFVWLLVAMPFVLLVL